MADTLAADMAITKKPCPFCGAHGGALEVRECGCLTPPIIYQVECANCGALGASFSVKDGDLVETTTKTLAIQAWNQRSGF